MSDNKLIYNDLDESCVLINYLKKKFQIVNLDYNIFTNKLEELFGNFIYCVSKDEDSKYLLINRSLISSSETENIKEFENFTTTLYQKSPFKKLVSFITPTLLNNNVILKIKSDDNILFNKLAIKTAIEGIDVVFIFDEDKHEWKIITEKSLNGSDSHYRNKKIKELVEEIINVIRNNDNTHELIIPPTDEAKVSEILSLLQYFRKSYQDDGEIPVLANDFEHKLFNTYRCYMDLTSYFPKKFLQHADNRGAFVEIARQGIPGQTSFSTTLPGITRGNHFHTRKIERFAVIKGKALIQLRRIGSEEVYDFYLCGDEPAYVDMPIWYTHNIKNIGEDILYTIFWINEPFDSNDPDTYFEIV
jgi:dTDP-4-dehydrorhamnose 3,5-epimerase-like enzyme